MISMRPIAGNVLLALFIDLETFLGLESSGHFFYNRLMQCKRSEVVREERVRNSSRMEGKYKYVSLPPEI